jgi:hypothetical protein
MWRARGRRHLVSTGGHPCPLRELQELVHLVEHDVLIHEVELAVSPLHHAVVLGGSEDTNYTVDWWIRANDSP